MKKYLFLSFIVFCFFLITTTGICNEKVNTTTHKNVTQDENYIVRAWSAVLTYLLSDFSFVYEHTGSR
mgnify:CR=1 FL=1